MIPNLVRYQEALVLRPAVETLGAADLFDTQGLPMRRMMTLLGGAPYAMMLLTMIMVGRSCSALNASSALLSASRSLASSTR